MSDDKLVEVEGEKIRLSEFVKQKCETSELVEFNLDRINDSLEQVTEWEEYLIPVKEDDDTIKYYNIKKIK